MLNFIARKQRTPRFCDGVSRRSFLQIGALGLGGLTLPQLLASEAAAGVGRSHKSVIMVFLCGGPPHQDMYDLKMDAPSEIRGEFAPIQTSVPGIEICTAEKTMERRTSCLQSNVDFLQKTITRLSVDHQQKLDAASRQIEALKATVAGLQKTVSDLQAAQAKAAASKPADDAKGKPAAPAPKEAPPAGKEPAK